MLSSDPPCARKAPNSCQPRNNRNLIYLSRRAETHSSQQHQYLDCVAEVAAEIARHPRFDTGRHDR